jgi:G3E family GTPase
MSGTPFDRATSSIPVTIVTHGPMPARDDETALLHLDPALHDHAAGAECVACAAAGDVRAMLFDLLTASRQEKRRLHAVIIDASDLTDAQPVIAKLDPHTAAHGLRDHTVLRSFHLSRVI